VGDLVLVGLACFRGVPFRGAEPAPIAARLLGLVPAGAVCVTWMRTGARRLWAQAEPRLCSGAGFARDDVQAGGLLGSARR